MNTSANLLTAKEVATLICKGQISESTIMRYARQGKLPFIQISEGKRRLFNRETVQRFFAEKQFRLTPSRKTYNRLF